MSRGFSLVEVLVALCILMASTVVIMRMHMASIRAQSYAEGLTRAAGLATAKLTDLGGLPLDSADLGQSWHQDPDNPVRESGMAFYRFWSVRDGEAGKDVAMYVAWSGKDPAEARNFASQEELQASRCPRVVLREFLFTPDW
ncbi:MAG TPA: type II secretion system protein [Deltaproteobacteria bacterium]|nr:type II secretion system protein [Deltaproteobacteria bacterium]HQI80610.1 type II secretion system protein [Deltaproteobacteria bacterium]